MDSRWRAGLWIILLFAAGATLELLQTSSYHTLSSRAEIASLVLPARVQFVSSISHPHSSGTALVFDAADFSLTCYFRHPPSTLILFSNDTLLVRGHLEPTPNGTLCIVDEVSPHVDA